MGRLLNEFTESFRIAGEQIRVNKTRSFLTALGVIIGILAVTLMGTAIRGIDIGFDRSLNMLGRDVLYVQKWPWRDVGEDWAEYRNREEMEERYAEQLNDLIGKTPNSRLQIAVPAVKRTATVTFDERSANGVFTIGTTAEYADVVALDFVLGRFFSNAEARAGSSVCVLGYDVASTLFPSADPIGKKVRVRGQRLEVIGVLDKQGRFLGVFSFDSQIVMPVKTMRRFYAHNWDTDIQVKTRPGADKEAATDEVIGHMRVIRRLMPEEKNDFEVNRTENLQEAFGPVKAGIATAGLFITGLSLFVGAIGIMNITFVSVRERTREIGTRRAVGATKRAILTQFLVEAISICLLGGLVGMGITFGASMLVQNLFPQLPFAFSGDLVILGLAVSTLTGIFSGFAPAYSAARLDPAHALRHA